MTDAGWDTDGTGAGQSVVTRIILRIKNQHRGSLVLLSLLVVLTRIYRYGSVFRKGDIVLLANDPYYYRFNVERVVTAATGPADFAALTAETTTSPFLIALLSWMSELAGGTPDAVGIVLAWYPVLAAVATACLVYAIAYQITDRPVVGFVAGVVLAITPVHVVRTALGFSDHHAFDYAWLAATLFALVVLARIEDPRSRTAWLAAGGLAVALAGQAFSWQGGVLLTAPLGIYTVYRVFAIVHAEVSPVAATAPLASGITAGAVAIVFVHMITNWLPTAVVLVPLGLAAGAVGAVMIGELAHRTPAPTRVFLGLSGLAVCFAGGLLFALDLFGTIMRIVIAYQTRVTDQNVVEAVSLLGGGQWGLITGPFSLFGLLLFVFVPVLGVATWRLARRPRAPMAVLVIYAWCLLGAAIIQRRFAGDLAVVVAPLIGIGAVSTMARFGLIRPVRPLISTERIRLNPDVSIPRTVLVAFTIAMVVSASFLVIPIKMNQVTHSAAEHDAARWMQSQAAENGLDQPRPYVLSWWSDARMYNYFVTNRLPRYSYARTQYGTFLGSAASGPIQDRCRGPCSFIITTDEHKPPVRVTNGSQGDLSMYARLHIHRTSRSDGVPGLAHYRLLWISDDESITIFKPVSGATITGTTTPNATVTVSTTVPLEQTTFTYRRRATANATGAFAITVPYPGEYSVGNSSVVVSETAVKQGREVQG